MFGDDCINRAVVLANTDIRALCHSLTETRIGPIVGSMLKRLLSLACLSLVMAAGCRPRFPDISGKWHGFARLPDSRNPKELTPCDVTLVLSQQASVIQGNAALKVANSKETINVPLSVGTIDRNGKVAFEGSAQENFGTVHFSFDGAASKNDTMNGKAAMTAQVMIFGNETEAGPFSFTRETKQ